MGKVGSVGCAGFLVEVTGACVLVDDAGFCLSGGQDCIWWCVLGCLELIMILGSLSANGWVCVHVLPVVWHGEHWSLLFVEWSWILALRQRSLGELSLIHSTWGWEVSGGPMS